MNNVINFIAFQSIWLIAVIGAANEIQWPAILAVLTFAYWQLSAKRRHPNDIKFVLFALVIGLVLDGLWQFLGLVQFQLTIAINSPDIPVLIPPIWILLLWITLALSLNHSLSWLKKNSYFPLFFGFFGAPLSYYAGHRLGALDYPNGIVIFCIVISISWACVLYLFANYENFFANQQQKNQ